MTSLLMLMVWMLTGVAAAAVLSPTTDTRWGWAPIAAILGPLWVAIAVEQRGSARDQGARVTEQPTPASIDHCASPSAPVVGLLGRVR